MPVHCPEIAARVCRAADALGLPTVAIYSAEDKLCKHVKAAKESIELPPHKDGPVAPYLDAASVVDAALKMGCDALHPGAKPMSWM